MSFIDVKLEDLLTEEHHKNFNFIVDSQKWVKELLTNGVRPSHILHYRGIPNSDFSELSGLGLTPDDEAAEVQALV